ncbi:hypothetical protein FH972_006823 [Carpinus fangiana]|uniref:Uncharacterized protein n=1 Tax=Carpinus fangiana TaxID=176857 RepID=A0A5N6QX02_9ROSI|nr:hypothetical protein FH972_006823 [Carpinus fangiana]
MSTEARSTMLGPSGYHFKLSPDLAATEHDEACVDGRAGLVGELLVENASGQGQEWGLERIKGRRLVKVDQGGDERIGAAEVLERDFHFAIARERLGNDSQRGRHCSLVVGSFGFGRFDGCQGFSGLFGSPQL